MKWFNKPDTWIVESFCKKPPGFVHISSFSVYSVKANLARLYTGNRSVIGTFYKVLQVATYNGRQQSNLSAFYSLAM